MYNKTIERFLHYIMCLNGGFLGGYCILFRNGIFGSAQTANLIELCLDLCGRNLQDFTMRILGLLLYCAGMLFCMILSRTTSIHMQRYAIFVDAAGLFIICCLPESIDPFVAILPVFFMTATQWTVFHGVDDYNCSTIFSTNNLRQCISASMEYVIDKENTQKDKAIFYGLTLFWYHLGVCISYFACQCSPNYACLFALPFLLFAWMLTLRTSVDIKFKKKWRKCDEKNCNGIC